jgi:Protein of unknown function (DUF4199)
MKKIVLVCGSIAGLIVAAMMFISMAVYHKEGNFDNGMLIGYASMIIAFSLIFVGIKNYRDKYNGGAISFGRAFKVGVLIALVASTFYVVAWLIDYYFFMPDFMEKYAAYSIDKLKAAGASAEKIAEEAKEMAFFSDMYKNPLFVILFTFIEILPVGLLVSLIAALVLKRKRQESVSH